jgi:aldehyde dehydrogenase (NAD+)
MFRQDAETQEAEPVTETGIAADARRDAETAPSALRALFERQTANRWAMARTTARERVDRLKRLRDELGRRRGDLCAAIQTDFGKHPVETELTEVMPSFEEIGFAIRHLAGWMRPRRVGTPLTLLGGRSEIRFEPKGLVLVLAPWNYPWFLVAGPVVAAVAAGNCVMVRPSQKTPCTSRFLREFISSVFPDNEVAVVDGDHGATDELLGFPFDHVFFTGSASVGRRVMGAAARHLSPVTLELGGKSPVIVDDTADIDVAAERVAWGKFINAGQTCVAPDYALVHQAVARRFAAAVAKAIAKFYGPDEDTRAGASDLARMVDDRACRRLDRAIRDTLAAGGRLVCGGRVDAAARRVAPTVLADVPDDSAIMGEEIFGPVLPILTFSTLDEAAEAVRARAKPLALYLFSRRRANIDFLLASTTAGGTCVNHVVVHVANPHLPFGGVGESGMGQYHGRFGFEAMSHARAVYTQWAPSATRWLYPPYTARSRRILAWLERLTG